MKKFLMAITMSGMLMAGGDISPVEPVTPDSSDFWGQIGISYQFQDSGKFDFADKENNAFSTAVTLGFEKEVGYGFGIGGEVSGWTDFGMDVADFARVYSVDQTSAKISQAYMTYKFGNTAIKAGRQALPKAVSPWAWSDREVGVLETSYDGIVVTNTDISDTTLVGAWIKNVFVDNNTHGKTSDNGLFMIGMVNKSLANNTLAISGYYVPESKIDCNFVGKAEDTWSIWASDVYNIGDYYVGVQGAYADGDYSNTKETYGIAGKIGTSFGNFDAEGIVGYINDGDYSLVGAGSGVGTSAFWTDYEMIGDAYGEDQIAVIGKVGYKIGIGKFYGGIGYWDFDDKARKDSFGGRIGYAFNLKGVDAKIEYRYLDENFVASNLDRTRQRVRLEAFYKF